MKISEMTPDLLAEIAPLLADYEKDHLDRDYDEVRSFERKLASITGLSARAVRFLTVRYLGYKSETHMLDVISVHQAPTDNPYAYVHRFHPFTPMEEMFRDKNEKPRKEDVEWFKKHGRTLKADHPAYAVALKMGWILNGGNSSNTEEIDTTILDNQQAKDIMEEAANKLRALGLECCVVPNDVQDFGMAMSLHVANTKQTAAAAAIAMGKCHSKVRKDNRRFVSLVDEFIATHHQQADES